MTKQKRKYPISNDAQETGGRALEVFNFVKPKRWVVNDVRRDFGWDLIVSLRRNGEVREDFFVQLKGSGSPYYGENRDWASVEMKTSTVRWLHEKTMPTIICLCDTGNKDEPLYWVWIDDVFKELAERNSSWGEQANVALHIPVANFFNEEAFDKIEKQVVRYYKRHRIDSDISAMILPGYLTQDSSPKDNLSDEIVSKAKEDLNKAGVCDSVETDQGEYTEALSSEDQERYRRIQKISSHLEHFQDDVARELLDKLAPEIEEAANGIKARYFNNRGVLTSHNMNHVEAWKWFKKAVDLRPKNPKYMTNLLNMEFALALGSKPLEESLPSDWIPRLCEVVKTKHPQALLLKTYYLGLTEGAEAAERFLKDSGQWDEKPVTSRFYIANILKDLGDNESAVKVFSEAEKIEDEEKNSEFWAVYGLALLRKASNVTSGDLEFTVGSGSSHEEEMRTIEKAKECYERAYCLYMRLGFPVVAEAAIVNYSAILTSFGMYEQCRDICSRYLDFHPESLGVREKLASTLLNSSKYKDAVPHATKVYDEIPHRESTYEILLLALFGAYDFEDVVELVEEKGSAGFMSTREEGLSRWLAAVSHYELGDDNGASEPIARMKTIPELSAYAFLAEGDIARRKHASEEELVEIYRKGLEQNPEDPILALHLAFSLAPPSKSNSNEIIKCLGILADEKRLSSDECILLAKAHIVDGKPENAQEILEKAVAHYPEKPRLIYEMAHALSEVGNEKGALDFLEEYLKKGHPDYATFRNMAILANNAGELDVAISLFQKALSASEEKEAQRLIHLQLFELKRKRHDNAEEIIKHVIEFGKLTGDDAAEEVRYIMMSLILPLEDGDLDKPKIKSWHGEFHKRLQSFTKKNPDCPYFSSISIPTDIPPEEQREHILFEISRRMLPINLASVGIEISTRGLAWPLTVRAHLLPGRISTFHYWSFCTVSKVFSNAIHIWYPPGENNEMDTLGSARRVCVDLTALLTLAEFSLLDDFTRDFDEVIIAHGTRVALQIACNPPFEKPHPLAERIEKWRLGNRSKIRVRSTLVEEIDRKTGDSKIILRKESQERLQDLVPDGVGESLLLAKSLNLPLYSDEAVVRGWASKTFTVKTFSTLALAEYLRKSGLISLSSQASLFAAMIRKNFRIVTFTPEHMLVRLKEISEEKRVKGEGLPNRDDLQNDEILGAFLREFGESKLEDATLMNIAVIWWVSILADADLQLLLDSCMKSPCFTLMIRTQGGVLTGINAKEPIVRLSVLWAAFLWRAYRKKVDLVGKAWLGIKHCCSDPLLGGSTQYEQLLFGYIPNSLARIIEQEKEIDQDKKLSFCIELQNQLPNTDSESDRFKFQEGFRKSRPSFF